MSNSKHYFYSLSEVILPGESQAVFEELEIQLRAELKPEGCLEEQIVQDILYMYVSKSRVMRTTRARYTKEVTGRDLESFGKTGPAELDFMDRANNLGARIDGRIDKNFARLVRVKEHKRYEASQAAPKQLPASPPIAPALESAEPSAEGGNTAEVEAGNPASDSQPKDE